MANVKIKQALGRQWPLVLSQPVDFTNIADNGVAVVVASIPAKAIVQSASFVTKTAFGAGKTLNIGFGDAPTALGAAVDVAAVGTDVLAVTGNMVGSIDVVITPTSAMTAGAGVLYITYIIQDRENEAQPPKGV